MISKIGVRLQFGCLERPLSVVCYKYALFVGAHPWYFVISPLLSTLILGIGYLYRTDILNIDQLVTPLNGRSLSEKEVAMTFVRENGPSAPSRSLSEDGLVILVVVAQDGGNVLRPQYREATLNLNEFMLRNARVDVDRREYRYEDVCQRHNGMCFTNGYLYALDIMYSDPSPYDDNSYPIMSRGVRRFYVGEAVGGVTLDADSGQIVEALAFRLVYQMRPDDQSKRAADSLAHRMQAIALDYDDDLLDVAVYHSTTLSDEILRNSEDLSLRFLACCLILFAFSQLGAATTINFDGAFYVDWTKSKFYVASAGLLSAAMGVLSAMGLLFYCGYPYSGLCDAMPFLVISVRLDNTFLMISAVARTDGRLGARKRLACAMSEAAVSITVTVLTDILSFAVGLATDFLAVQMFSLYAVVAMATTFAYQLTLVMSVLFLTLKLEEANKHCLLISYDTSPPDRLKRQKIWTRLFMLGSRSPEQSINANQKLENGYAKNGSNYQLREKEAACASHEGSWISNIIEAYYAPFIMHSTMRISISLVYVLYLMTAIYGCLSLEQGLEPIKLLLPDSYAIKYYKRMDEYFWKMGTQAQIVFARAGDLANATNRRQILRILREFADSPHGMGANSLDFWLLSFERFASDQGVASLDQFASRTDFARNVDFFLSFDENSIFRSDVIWNNASSRDRIDACRGLVGLKNFSSASDQIDTVDQFRSIADKYAEFEISTFHPFWPYVDQFQTVLPNTLQEIYSGVGFMILIALFFIPSLTCSVIVALAILSIDVGVCGFMAFWSINLDVVSMITIVMSIGFSVDFTAHIAHAFVISPENGPVEKTAHALRALAWPILEGAICTLMGILVLSGTRSYVMTAFFRTVFLVIAIGLAHALIFLPVVLSVFCDDWRRFGDSLKRFRLIFIKIGGKAIEAPKNDAFALSDVTILSARLGAKPEVQSTVL